MYNLRFASALVSLCLIFGIDILINHQLLKEVDNFQYLSGILLNDGGTQKDLLYVLERQLQSFTVSNQCDLSQQSVGLLSCTSTQL